MKAKLFLKILLGIIFLLILAEILTRVLLEPFVGKKIEAAWKGANRDALLTIDKVHLHVLRSGMELEGLTITPKQLPENRGKIYGETASVGVRGIRLYKALIKKEIDIDEVAISDCNITGTFPPPRKDKKSVVSPLNIRVDRLLFDKIDLALGISSTAQTYSLHGGLLNVYDLLIEKQDTLSVGLLGKFDFGVKEFESVTADSLYTFTGNDLYYYADSKTLSADSLSVLPNYPRYDFTSRFEYQTNRFEAIFGGIAVHDFNGTEIIESGSLISSFIEIGSMDLQVFKDKRKKFHHVDKMPFQEFIYNYPGMVRIDSIRLQEGDVTYTEHAMESHEVGILRFNDISAGIFKITNDTVYKTEKAAMVLDATALLMGRGKMSVLLKSELYDPHNTFSLTGTLFGMEAKELNPILDKSAHITVKSGKIDRMDFSFSANNKRSDGSMVFLYHGLEVAVRNKRTDKTTAIKERVISYIANLRLPDSNPLPGREVRVGVIDYERDPERYLFGYCWKSIFSGMTSSLKN